MNNLVAYGDDSDEESSPRRKSSEGQRAVQADQHSSPRQRRDSDVYFEANIDEKSTSSSGSPSPRSSSQRSENFTDLFAEPPPPKRRTANDSTSNSPAVRTPMGMAKVTSVSSLVSYTGGEQEEEDTFDKAEMRAAPGNSGSPSAEPAPPARVSQDEGSDEENERLIDEALQESSNVIKESTAEGSPNGGSATPTPHRNDSPQTSAQVEPMDIDDQEIQAEIDIPPSPPGECDPDMQRKFESFFEKKAQGLSLNAILQSKKEFINPACYELFIRRYELEEKGSNFKTEIFNPLSFPENNFYDSIAEEQRKIMEKMTTDKAKKPTAGHR